MKKKGGVDQVFIYLMVIIVVGVLFLVGSRAIGDIINRSCEIGETTFKSNLEDSLNRNSRFGSHEAKGMRAPCNYDMICFTNHSLDSNRVPYEYTIIKEELEAETGNNVFISKRDLMLPFLEAPTIVTNEPVVCINASGGTFNFLMQGAGGGLVLITPS